jgi:uncharacterized adenine-specific methylase MG184
MAKTDNLRKAMVTKNDEFYTQLYEIENELKYYSGYLKDKIIYCNCDSPKYSNFWKYFYDNFHILGLKGLVSTYLDNEQAYKTTYDGETVSQERLVGNGDFRSEECIKILKGCDVVITNPPFSLIRPFFDILIANKKQFLFIGTINVVKYLNVFKEIKENKVWTGKTHSANYIRPDGSIYQIRNTIWITNIGENHKELVLTKKYEENNYITYHNFDAINVDKVADIPYDYCGIMGVPITFIEKYDINQFKIVGIDRLPYSIELGIGEMGEKWCNDFFSSGGKGHYTPTMKNLCLYENGKATLKFSRILIQGKKDCEK